MISIIDCGLGNLSSLLNAFNKIYSRAEIFGNPKNIKKSVNLVLQEMVILNQGLSL